MGTDNIPHHQPSNAVVTRMEVIMQKRFINFLKNTGVTLTKPQMELAKLIIKSSEENKVIASLLYGGRKTGKTTLFSLLEEFFSTVEVSDKPNFTNPYLDGAAFKDYRLTTQPNMHKEVEAS